MRLYNASNANARRLPAPEKQPVIACRDAPQSHASTSIRRRLISANRPHQVKSASGSRSASHAEPPRERLRCTAGRRPRRAPHKPLVRPPHNPPTSSSHPLIFCGTPPLPPGSFVRALVVFCARRVDGLDGESGAGPLGRETKDTGAADLAVDGLPTPAAPVVTRPRQLLGTMEAMAPGEAATPSVTAAEAQMGTASREELMAIVMQFRARMWARGWEVRRLNVARRGEHHVAGGVRPDGGGLEDGDVDGDKDNLAMPEPSATTCTTWTSKRTAHATDGDACSTIEPAQKRQRTKSTAREDACSSSTRGTALLLDQSIRGASTAATKMSASPEQGCSSSDV